VDGNGNRDEREMEMLEMIEEVGLSSQRDVVIIADGENQSSAIDCRDCVGSTRGSRCSN